MRLRKPKESDIQRAVLDYLKLCGALVIRVNSGGMYAGERKSGGKRFVRFNSEPGCSDILACLPQSGDAECGPLFAAFAAIEVKRPGKIPTPHQQTFLEDVTRRGGVALVVTSVQDLVEQLRERGFYAP
jgi:VRR-NUC domain